MTGLGIVTNDQVKREERFLNSRPDRNLIIKILIKVPILLDPLELLGIRCGLKKIEKQSI